MRQLFILAPLAFASAAQADTTAIYASPGDVCSMTVKIASDGDLFGEIKGKTPGTVSGRSYYFVGGKDYFVDRTQSGDVVMRLEDVRSLRLGVTPLVGRGGVERRRCDAANV